MDNFSVRKKEKKQFKLVAAVMKISITQYTNVTLLSVAIFTRNARDINHSGEALR